MYVPYIKYDNVSKRISMENIEQIDSFKYTAGTWIFFSFTKLIRLMNAEQFSWNFYASFKF